MRTIGVALVVVLMVLRTAARSGRGSDDFIRHEETTTPFPTTPPSTRTTTTDSTTIPTPTPTPTSEFPTEDCSALGCRIVTGSDGFDTCDCSTYNCDNVTCGPDQECVMQDVAQCDYPWCPPEPNCVPKLHEPPIETTTETTTGTTAPVCPTVPCSESSGALHYDSAGCPYCRWGDPICGWIVQCGPDEDCLPSEESSDGFACFPKYGTTTIPPPWTNTETTTQTTIVPTTSCPVVECGTCPSINGSNGCPTCTCYPPTPTTIEPTPEPTTTNCPVVTCGPYCRLTTWSGGCPTCWCHPPRPTTLPRTTETPCESFYCAEDQECIMQEYDCNGDRCLSSPVCVPRRGTTTETPTETTTPFCPDMSSCTESSYCYLDYTYLTDGCPTCVCSVKTPSPTPTTTTECPIEDCVALGCRTVPGSEGCDTRCDCSPYNCDTVTCDPDQYCVMQNVADCLTPWCRTEPTCVPHGTTTETTTETTTATPTWTTTPFCPDMSSCTESSYCYLDHTYLRDGCPTCICTEKTPPPTPTTTPPCPIEDCVALGCRTVPGSEGCDTRCDCSTYNCDTVACDPDQYCVMQDVVECYYPWCPPEPTCVPYGTTTETPTETPTATPTATTTPFCPDMSSCTESSYCYLDYTYLTDGCPTCVCSVKTTTPTPTPTPECRIDENCFALGCRTVLGPDGCDTCDCSTSNCDTMTCDPDQYCVMQDVVECSYPWCPPEPTCVRYVSTTPTTTPTVTTTDLCPMVTCIQGCRVATDYKGCTYCDCVSTCEGVTCPSGEQCEMLTTCDPSASSCSACVPIPVTTAPCSTIECEPDCVSDSGSDGCPTCACPPNCKKVTCDPGYVCEMEKALCFTTPCYREPKCVAVQTTTASCPVYKCGPDCVPGTGSDGCPTCDCPPSCQTVKCSAGHECQLVNVTCKKDPCFPQPQCVPTENPCTGTPNTRRCGRFRNRWTYNSVTDKCEKFRHYGCTPSLNTFLSPKACKNKCQGSAQSICEDVVCEKNCYKYTRKNKCPKCICPNPCEGFKCREGYECKMRESKCENKDPKPFCARKS